MDVPQLTEDEMAEIKKDVSILSHFCQICLSNELIKRFFSYCKGKVLKRVCHGSVSMFIVACLA